MKPLIAPSILSSDFANLESELARISSADLIHVDVMDGHFVPNLTLGVPVVAAISRVTEVPLDVHLMIEDPDRWALDYVRAGASSVTFHAEATTAPVRLAAEIRAAGAKASIAVRPMTPVEPFFDHLHHFDMILVMTVEPGFGGQKFIESCLPKIRRLREAIDRSGHDVRLQVDGGVSVATIGDLARAGADTFVAGSAVFGADNPESVIARLRDDAGAALA